MHAVDRDAERTVDRVIERDDVTDLQGNDLGRSQTGRIESHARLDGNVVQRGLELFAPKDRVLAALVLEQRLTGKALEHRCHRRERHADRRVAVLLADAHLEGDDEHHVRGRRDLREMRIELLLDHLGLDAHQRLVGVFELAQRAVDDRTHEVLLDLGQRPLRAGRVAGATEKRSIAANVIGSGNCNSAAPGSGLSERMTMYEGLGSERTYSSYVSCSTLTNVLLAPGAERRRQDGRELACERLVHDWNAWT